MQIRFNYLEQVIVMNLPIGISDFKKLRDGNCSFVDKSLFIKEVIESGSEVLLFTRPRRFGKTINMSMLYYFLDDNTNSDALFANTAILNNKAFCAKHQNQHPVIFITFKGIKDKHYKDAENTIRGLIGRLYRHFAPLLESSLSADDIATYQALKTKSSDKDDLKHSLAYLCQFLKAKTGKPAYILLDEYDTPLTTSYVHNYYDDMIDLMRGIMGEAFKDNSSLAKGVITGITQISQESIFSGFNNPKVFNMLNEQCGEYFGFTENEVIQLLEDDNHSEQLTKIKYWYNGYQIGKHTLYNPWSIINCMDQNYNLRPYWLNTSDNALVKNLIASGKRGIKAKMIALLQGETIERPLEENLVFPRLEVNEGAVWSLLHASGYLSSSNITAVDYGADVKLSIPNKEVSYVYTDMVKHWFTDTLDADTYRQLITNLASGSIAGFQFILSEYLLESGSYFDFNKNTPEQVFHTFMLGLVVGMRDDYVISSNKEAGFGRYDLTLLPKDKSKQGLLLEFKTADSAEQLAEKAKDALAQIQDNQYLSVFKQQAISSVLLLGLAFCGKQVEITAETVKL